MTPEEYLKEEIRQLTSPYVMLGMAWQEPEVLELPSIARLKDARPWLAENIRIADENEGRRLRLTFRGGTRREQAVILNALLRIYMRCKRERIEFYDGCVGSYCSLILEITRRIESGGDPRGIESDRQAIKGLRSIKIPPCLAEIARLQEITVMRWAK